MKYDYLLSNGGNEKVLFDSKKSIKEWIELNIDEINSKGIIFNLIRRVKKVEKVILIDVVNNINKLSGNIVDESLLVLRKEKSLKVKVDKLNSLLN